MGVLYYISVKYCGKPFQGMTSTSPIAVRCCSNDDCGTCKSVCPGHVAPPLEFTTFSEAQQKCSDLGMRLCTKKELASKICCGTGCGIDSKYVWYAPEGNVFRSINPILSEPYIHHLCQNNVLIIQVLLIFFQGLSSKLGCYERSNHGTCGNDGNCICQNKWSGADCSGKFATFHFHLCIFSFSLIEL